MNGILNLTTIDAISTTDYLFGYRTVDLDARKIALSVLLTYLNGAMTFTNGRYAQQTKTASATGYSITIDNDDEWIWLFVNQGAGYAAGTLVFPSSPVDQQEILIKFNNTLTSLTLNGNGKTIQANGWSDVTDADVTYRMKYDDETQTWYIIA